MHGHTPGSVLLVNAEVDSMGGVIDGGVGIDGKSSPRRAAIEKAQAELRQEYDVREERRRELEFLEKGGNPLDFKLRPAASISVQSTSLTDQPAEQFVTSEAKGSFALAASPHGDSVESSGRPGAPSSREPTSGDNLLLFDGESYPSEGKRNSKHTGRRNNIFPSEHSSRLDGNHKAKESEDSVIFRLVKSQAYARRNRSRSSRETVRACSTDAVPSADGNGSLSLPSARHGSRDAKGSVSEAKAQKDHTVSSISNSKSTGPNGTLVSKTLTSDNRVDMELDAGQAHKTATGLPKVGLPEEPEVMASRDLLDGNDYQQLPVGDDKVPGSTACVYPDLGGQGVSAGLDCKVSTVTAKTENHLGVGELSGFSTPNRDERLMENKDQNGTTALSTKGLDSESSSTQITHSLDGNTASDPCLNKVHANGNSNEQKLVFEESLATAAANVVKQNSETKAVDALCISSDIHDSVQKNLSNNLSDVKIEEEICDSKTGFENEGRPPNNIEGTEPCNNVGSKTENKLDNLLGDSSNLRKGGFSPQGGPSSTAVSSNCELPDPTSSGMGLVAASEPQTCVGDQLKVLSKQHEDFILKEAQTIEAKRKRISELSVENLPSEYRRKSHWDFVLEEMAWLANDFMQERLWKITAASQICHLVAFTGRFRFNEQNLRRKQRKVAHILAKAVMQFWRSAETFLSSNDPTVGLKESKVALVGSTKDNAGEAIEDRIGELNMETGKHLEEQDCGQSPRLAIQEYAVRFLKCNSFHDHPLQAEAPVTPDRISDMGILEREEHFSKESLFYTVLPGAMEEYKKSVESHWAQYEKAGNNMQQEEVETSMCDALSEFGSQENAYEEDEGETGAYYSPGNFEGRKSSKFAQKQRKTLLKSYPPRSYESGADLPYGMGNKLATQPSSLIGKRPNSLAVGSIPTKRIRTAARQRVLSPFSAAASGNVQIINKTDVSSGDNSSFQDDQSTLHGGTQFRKAMEVESTGEFGKQLPFDYTDISTKLKKKKKAKHLLYKNSMHSTEAGILTGKGAAYEQRWQIDSLVHNEQRDHAKKRSEGHHFESNGNSGVFGQHAAKRPKIMKQLADTSPENFAPVTGSIPSPVASQMSNMSNPNKLMKMIAGRDRGRKAKALKAPAGQSGSGSPWSLFEDQALVVLVHDMGPNWELVSDAINSTLQFKCIFRKPKECKERHKTLMDRNGGDGADSAEDSGSSQPYPSTLPGIPKGSARQLFQRLQGPMEEETLKSHFEKIILLGQQLHSRRNQNGNQELKQIAPVHNSHILAFSQVCPNNLNGGLTPLDLCDATTSSPDVLSLVYQGSHNSGLAISNQGSVAPVLPNSSANAMLQGSSGVTLGISLPSPSAALNAPTRDGQRYGAPRPPSLPIDEQQRIQQYNQMLSGRNIPQSGMTVPGAMPSTDRGVRMLPGGNGMGMMCGMNRGMSMPRPGFQGIGSAAMLNSGSMLPSSGVGIPSPVNMHTGAVSAQGNSMLGSRDALHLMRPGQNPEDQRQMMLQELQMQVTQGSSQGVPPYNGLSTAFSNQTIPPPVKTFPVQHQQQHQMPPQQSHVLGNPHHPRLQGNNHATNPQQQAYVLHLAKERQLQKQRYLHQQQFAATNPLMPHPQPQSQHPISSSMQNSSQIQQQVSSQPVSMPPPNSQHPLTPSSPMNPISSQSQQKHHLPTHGHGRNPQAGGVSLSNQMMKQRQRQQQQQQQQLQQPGRHHPQQRQQSQSLQQPAKLMKGLGRGNTMVHQNLAVDPSHVNGIPTTQGNQVVEKGEQVMHLMQGQGLYPGSGSNSIKTGKQLMSQSSNQCQPQQKMFPRPPSTSLKQLSQMPSHPDNCNQGQVPPVPSGHILPSQQPVPSLSMASSHQQQNLQPQQRQAGQPPHAIQRLLQLSRKMNSDPSMQSPAENIQLSEQPGNKALQMSTSTTMPQSCSELTSVVPVVSTASTPQWKAPEPLYDADSPNAATNLAAIGDSPFPNTVGAESMASPRQGLAQRQFSGSMSIHGQNVGTAWPQTPQQHQPSQPPTPPSPSASQQQQMQQIQQQQHHHHQQSPPHPPPPTPPSPSPSASQQQMQQIQQQQHHHHQQSPPHPPPPPPQSNPPFQHQQEPPQQQQPPQPQQSQQQHLLAGEGGLHARPTNSGSG